MIGVTTNVGFLRRLVASDEFASASIDTSWLDGPGAASLLERPAMPREAVEVAARVWAQAHGPSSDSPLDSHDGWRLSGPAAPTRVAFVDEEGGRHAVELTADDIESGGGAPAALDSRGLTVTWQGQPWRLDEPDPMRGGHARALATDADLVSPMPGTVLKVDVAVGDAVELGQQLGVVEAMKMELALVAPYDGTVSFVGSEVGAQVPIRHLLFTVDPA